MEKNAVEKLIDDICRETEPCIDYMFHSFDYDRFADRIRLLIETAMKQSK